MYDTSLFKKNQSKKVIVDQGMAHTPHTTEDDQNSGQRNNKVKKKPKKENLKFSKVSQKKIKVFRK